jgi:hypothetical protein
MSSHLAFVVLSLFAKGELNATHVQSIMAAARKDGWRPADVLGRKLAAAGTSGLYSGHVNRDVINACRAESLMTSTAQPYLVDIQGAGKIEMFLPHEAYYHIVATSGIEDVVLSAAEFAEAVGPGALLRQWAQHRDVNITDDVRSVAILGLHCDGVPYAASVRAGTAAKGIFVCSMNVFSSPSDDVRRRRQPLFTVQKAKICQCGCSGFHTFQKLYSVIVWSLRCLATGTSPTCRHDGTPWTKADTKARITSGIPLPRAAVLQLRGDWEFFETAFRFRSTSSDTFCWKCDATKSAGPYCAWDFSPTAAHRATCFGHGSYMRSCVETGELPTIFKAPGLSIDHVAIDSMHSGDLGIFQDAIGSLFWLEVFNQQWHSSKKKGLAALHEMLENYYKANRQCGYSRILPTLRQIRSKDPGYPYLKAKAAETRHLANFCLSLAYLHKYGGMGRESFKFKSGHRGHRLAGREDEHLGNLVRVFKGMADYQRELAVVPFSPDRCEGAMYRFLAGFKVLRLLWATGLSPQEERQAPFHLRPKAHMMQHLVQDQLPLWGSPVRSWCYRDEDFVGAIKTIAQRSKNPSTLESRLNEKLMLLEGLRQTV